MANIREIADGGSEPGFPTVAEMRESQRKGSEGIGLNEQSHNDDLRDFNQAPSINGEDEGTTPSGTSPLPWTH